ncbi:hypothetical protein DSM112329_02838 [Paraconexibacter sp. AEG42_29]|uniref:Rhodanese-related sulfurtransferase n=1 Tax=Paraconexibacter sp. AEG42_29 TaxID=2997339 RepID=A0AAU7AWI3_9ACTN
MPPEHHALERLQAWYVEQCDGEWEHEFGIEIDTLDNPGWRVEVQVKGTALENEPFSRTEVHRSEHDWVVCWTDTERGVFHAACGPRNLNEALPSFLHWAEDAHAPEP